MHSDTLRLNSAVPMGFWASGAPLARGVAAIGRGFLPFVMPVLIVAVWAVASGHRWISPKVLPDPGLVLDTFLDLVRGGDLGDNLVASLTRVEHGFLLGGAIGLVLGLAMGFSPTADAWIGPFFRTVTQVPSLVWIPLLMQLLGIDEALKLVVMAKACAIPVAVMTAAGIREIPRDYLDVARALRLSRWTQIRRIVLPGALPSIFSGLRQGLGHVWVSLIIVEMMASADGIGHLMSWGRTIFQLDIVIVAMIVIGLVGFSFDLVLRQVEERLLRWRRA